MEDASKQIFQTHGLSAVDAFILASKLKYDASENPYRIFASQKHMESYRNHAWMDRVMRTSAILEVCGRADAMQQELEEKTGHAELLKEMQEEEQRIEELLASGRKERSEGFLTCHKCKSKEVDVEQKQTRSADEPMTLFALCVKCGTRWTMK